MTDEGADKIVPVLDLNEVSLSYRLPRGDRLQVLEGISLAASAGQITCVSGRSGSGKTSLLYVAAGFLFPDRGTIRWQGRDMQGMSGDELARERRGLLGFVFQGAELIPSLSAAENVALVRGRDGRRAVDQRGAATLLARFGLAGRADNLPHQLSGGEQQRVAVARALVGDPAAVVLDEPTAYLDRQAADGIIKMLGDLRREGRALLVASHDDHVIGFCDRVLHLE